MVKGWVGMRPPEKKKPERGRRNGVGRGVNGVAVPSAARDGRSTRSFHGASLRTVGNWKLSHTLELAPASPPRFVTFYNGRIFYLFYSLTRLFKAGFFLERSFFRTTHIGVPLPRAREPHSAGGMLPPDV